MATTPRQGPVEERVSSASRAGVRKAGPLFLVVWVPLLLAASCGGDGNTDPGESAGDPVDDGIVCTDPEGEAGILSSDRQSAGAVADRGPAGITYDDGQDIVEMVTCRGGVVGALNLAGDYALDDWVSMVCRGMWEDGNFVSDEIPSFEFSLGVHEDARLRGVSSVSFTLADYDGPGTYDATLAGVRMGTELPDEERRPEVTGTGTLVIEWASWGEAALGTSSDLHLIGSFHGEISGDLTLSMDVPIFGCDDVA